MEEKKNKKNMPAVIIYSDGSSRGNPGRGGYGTRMEYRDPEGKMHVREMSRGYRHTTNNRMELLGAIAGLEALTCPCRVSLYSDSQYLVKAFQQNWIEGWVRRGWKNASGQPVKNPDLWKRLLRAMEPHEVTFHWVKGHDGNPGNERCDQLATAAADGDDLQEDTAAV